MARRHLVVLVPACAAVMFGGGGGVAARTSSRPAATVIDVLAGIRVASETSDKYDSSKFSFPSDADGDGCDTVAEVLTAESTVRSSAGAKGCDVTGKWTSVFDGTVTNNTSLLAVEQTVGLREAWVSGASAWSAAELRKFANDESDPRALVVVTKTSRNDRSMRDPAVWMPSREEYRCQYLADWVAVKAHWGLAMDETEHTAVRRGLLVGCAGLEMIPWGASAVSSPAATTSSIPAATSPTATGSDTVRVATTTASTSTTVARSTKQTTTVAPRANTSKATTTTDVPRARNSTTTVPREETVPSIPRVTVQATDAPRGSGSGSTRDVRPVTRDPEDPTVVEALAVVAEMSRSQVPLEIVREVFQGVKPAVLTAADRKHVAVALSQAPEATKEIFEESVDVYAEGLEEYVPAGSEVDVQTRRTVIAASVTTAASAAAASTAAAPARGPEPLDRAPGPFSRSRRTGENMPTRRESGGGADPSIDHERRRRKNRHTRNSIYRYGQDGTKKVSAMGFMKRLVNETASLAFTLAGSAILVSTLSGSTRRVAIIATVSALVIHLVSVMMSNDTDEK